MKQFYLVIIVFLLACSSQSKMGSVKYGKDGAIEGGSSITKCTPPTKRYAKSLDAVVKGSIDSIATLPSGNIELGLKQTVTRLSDYSSEGLDIDLILFRICEMANNRGLSSSQVETLNKAAIDAWSKSKSSSINVNNYGTNNGLMAGVVVVPEDKDIPLEQNFSISLFNQPEFEETYKGKIMYEIKPRQGVWYEPFIAYPLEEDSLVKGQIVPKVLGGYSITGGEYEFETTVQGQAKKYKAVYGSSSAPANPQNGYLFICEKQPSILIFGERSDGKKQYLQKLL